jgi:hypothetical protein
MSKKIFIMMGLLAFALLWGGQAIKAQEEDVGRLLQELENNTDRFSKSFDNALDNSQLNGTSTEGEITRFVHQFEDSIDHLKKLYDDRKDTAIAASESLSRAKAIDKVMRKYKLDATAQTDWQSVKDTIKRLAKDYNLKIKW